MRKIERHRIKPPQYLLTRRVRNALSALRLHYTLPDDVRAAKRAPVDFEILANQELNVALRLVFGDVCCYCEDQIGLESHGVEHFRPILSADDGRGSTSSDHYGWFAYEWKNMMLACPACLKAKRNLFPIENARAPILSSWAEASRSEAHSLLDPCTDDPLRHLALSREGVLVPRSFRGETTVHLLDLNRKNLVRSRGRIAEEIVVALNDISALGQKDRLINFATGVDGERSGAYLLCLREICDFLPTGYSKIGAGKTAVFRRNFISLVGTLGHEVWRQALSRYISADEITLGGGIRADEVLYSENIISDGRLASARIKRIFIRNFKGIESLELNLDFAAETRQFSGSMMILGENSTGKSSVLQAICLTLASPSHRRQWRLNPEDFISREKNSWQYIGNRSAEIFVELDSQKIVNLKIEADMQTFTGSGEPSILVLGYGAHRIFGRPDARNSSSVSRSIFHSLAAISDSSQWLREASEKEFNAVARALSEVLALKQDDRILRDENGNILVHAHGRTTPIERMSDGYKSLFSMAVDVMRRMVERWGNLEEARGIVLIDEVEAHLHPRWKMQVMSALRRSMPQVQFIVTTHDPLCLRGMQDGEVQVLVRDEENIVAALENLPSVQGLRAEQLLTSDYFGLASTTDPNLEILLQEYAALAGALPSHATRPDQALLDGLAGQIEEMTLVGDEASQQIVAEAVARYLAIRMETPLRAAGARRDAVHAVLDILDKNYGNEIH